MALPKLVVLKLVTLVSFVSAIDFYPVNKCTTVVKGDVLGNAVELPRLTIPRGELRWIYTVPALKKCRRPVGIQVTSCDSDGPPSPEIGLVHLDKILVKRLSYAFHSAVVDVTLYCDHHYYI